MEDKSSTLSSFFLSSSSFFLTYIFHIYVSLCKICLGVSIINDQHTGNEGWGAGEGVDLEKRRWLLDGEDGKARPGDTEKCICRAIPAARGRARSILSVWK